MLLGISCSVCKSVPVDTSISQHTCDVYHSIPVMYITACLWCISQHACDVYHSIPVMYITACLWCISQHACDVYLSMPVMYITACLTTCDVASKRNGGGGEITFSWEVLREVHDFITQHINIHTTALCLCVGQTILCPPLSKVGGMPPCPPFRHILVVMGIGFNFQNRLSETNPIRFSS